MSILSGVSLTEIFLEIWVSYQELQSTLTATAIMLRIDITKNKKGYRYLRPVSNNLFLYPNMFSSLIPTMAVQKFGTHTLQT